MVLAMAGFLAHAAYLAVPIVDDAGTSIAYGVTLLEGHGLRLNPASQVVEGYSSPLWTFLLGLSVPLGCDPVRVARVLGELLAGLAMLVFGLWAPQPVVPLAPRTLQRVC
jgi:hypothetical protein